MAVDTSGSLLFLLTRSWSSPANTARHGKRCCCKSRGGEGCFAVPTLTFAVLGIKEERLPYSATLAACHWMPVLGNRNRLRSERRSRARNRLGKRAEQSPQNGPLILQIPRSPTREGELRAGFTALWFHNGTGPMCPPYRASRRKTVLVR